MPFLLPFVPLIMAGLTAASVGTQIYSMATAPKIPKLPTTTGAEGVTGLAPTAAEKARQLGASEAGRQGTILTGSQGILAPAAVGKKQLLGE